MNLPSSLNQSITAAWATAAPISSAGPSSSTSTASTSAQAPKKRPKRAIGLNSPSGGGSPAPTSGTPAHGNSIAGPSSTPGTPGAADSQQPHASSSALSATLQPSSSNPGAGTLSDPSSSAAQTPSASANSRRKRPRQDPETLAAKYAPPELKLSFLGGLQDQITQLMEIVVLPLLHPEIYQHTGVPRPRGVLLHGVPGGGKTQLVRCLAGVSAGLVSHVSSSVPM